MNNIICHCYRGMFCIGNLHDDKKSSQFSATYQTHDWDNEGSPCWS